MKVLNISLDRKIFELNSEVRQRQIEYGQLFDELHILVLSPCVPLCGISEGFCSRRSAGRRYLDRQVEGASYPGKEEKISANVWVYGAGGNKFFRLFRAWKNAKRIIANKQINLVSAQDPFFTGLIGWLVRRKLSAKDGFASGGKIPLQIQIHTDFLSPYFRAESLMNKIRVFLAKFLVWRADKIRVVSQRIKDSLMKMGVAEEGIIVVPIYSNIRCQKDKFIALPLNAAPPAGGCADESGRINKYSLQEDTAPSAGRSFIFLTISRLVPVKNIGMQIEAMAEVVKKHPNVELWIIGDGQEKGNLKSQISNFKPATKLPVIASQLNKPTTKLPVIASRLSKAATKNSKLNEKIIFYGWCNNLGEIYQKADVFLLTSNYEGWGLAAIEAAACGLPIIMTDVGCAGEIIKNNESGIVIPVGNRKKLEQAMLRLIEDSDLRKKLGENAKQAILNLPNKEETLQLYKKSFGLQ